MREKIEYFVVKFLIAFLGFLPKNIIYKVTYCIAILFFKFEKRRSTLTIKNFTLAFPEKSQEEIHTLAKKCYESLSVTLAELIMLLNHKIDINNLIKNKDEALNVLHNLTKGRQNGVVFVTAHFSNWELLAQFLPTNGYSMLGIGRRGNNALIEENITTPFREQYGNTNIHKRNAILKIVKTLKQNGYVGLLIDQKAGKNESVKASFFGHEADTTSSVALLQIKYNPIIIPMFIAREEDGLYRIIIREITPLENPSIESLTQYYNDILEEVIKMYPEQWFWMHNRWRIAK